MNRSLLLLGLLILGRIFLFEPRFAVAQSRPSDLDSLRLDADNYARMRKELDRVNAEVRELKRADRSVRNDYRLRERMADAEALAQKLTAAEARLRARRGEGHASGSEPGSAFAPPQPTPQDGTMELEAKADLFADQARKLFREADLLAKAAEQIRGRKALRRQAGAWERDPFTGLESSKRSLSLGAHVTTPGTSAGDSANGTRGPTVSTGSAAGGLGSVPGTIAVAPPAPALSPAPAAGASDSKGGIVLGLSSGDSSTAAKSAPSPISPSISDHLAVEQRLFLDPATAAELRNTLNAAGPASDPEALEGAAALLRNRAKALDAQAQALHSQSRTP